MEERVVIERRYRGFDRVAQGGYSSGLLGGRLGGAVGVRLRAPVPMEEPLTITTADGGAELRDAERVLASAAPLAELGVEPPADRPTLAEAEEAAAAYPGHLSHPFPACFCCGPDRAEGDGLRVFPGPLGRDDAVAAPWRPGPDLAGPDGAIRPEFVWAAFDCPQLWALMIAAPAGSGEHVVTAGLETELRGDLVAGESYVVLAWPGGREGRKLYAEAALLAPDGSALAVSRQTALLGEAGVPLGVSA